MNPSELPAICRILIIDDNPAIHEDFRKILCDEQNQNQAFEEAKHLFFGKPAPKNRTLKFILDSAYQGLEGARMVEAGVRSGDPYTLAFVDVRMPPGMDGVETISLLWKQAPDMQIVLCTAYSDYAWEEIFHKLGTSDNLLILKKPFDNIEVLQLAHTLAEKSRLNSRIKKHLQELDQLVDQRTLELQSNNQKLQQEAAERIAAEEALRKSEERFSKAFLASPMPLAIQSGADGRFVDVNLGFQELTGFARSELIDRTPTELGIWDQAAQPVLYPDCRNLASHINSKSSETKDVLLSMEAFESGTETFHLILAQDVTEQQRLEGQLRQAQKMEAIGQLAAGVAHDFNNSLQVIQGYSGLLAENEPLTAGGMKQIQRVIQAATRASGLVRQLLAFSHKTPLQSEPVDICTILSNVSEMLKRLLPENIVISIAAAPNPPLINVDPGMFEQMLLNLAINARDAMPEGGWLTISADEVEQAPRFGGSDPVLPHFLCLSVADTGCGMSPEVLAHIFEPFFTTKPIGRGTGLGLATVYGIAQQHGGWVEVQSQPGKGTKFRIYIPVCDRAPSVDTVDAHLHPSSKGHESILVVEDEQELREFLVEILTAHGYQVFEAESGPKALVRWSEQVGEIQALLTDIIMPGGMNGRQLAEHLQTQDPTLKVIFTSGYDPGDTCNGQMDMKDRHFIAKPYTATKLLTMIRQCLDERH